MLRLGSRAGRLSARSSLIDGTSERPEREVRHARALRPAIPSPDRRPRATSLAGEAEGRDHKSPKPEFQELRETATLSAYDGRTAIGFVAPLGNRFEAYFVSDVSCGVFDTAAAALAALLAEPAAAVGTPAATQPHVLAGGCRHG
jgi:hypothetical protein